MKKRLILGFPLVLILAGGMSWILSEDSQAQGATVSQFSLSSDGVNQESLGDHFTGMEGSYFQSGGVIWLRTWYRLYNASTTTSITIRSIYVLQHNGLDGPILIYDGLDGTVIPPLGARAFPLHETGIDPVIEEGGGSTGPFMTIVSWDGPSGSLAATGTVNNEADGAPTVGSRTILPLFER